MPDLATPRLALRPLRPEDADGLHRLWTDEDVRRFLWDGEVIPPEQTAAVVAESGRLFAAERLGLWGAWPREGGGLCGVGGLWYFREPPALELIFALGRPHWGRGLATELAGAVVDYARVELGMPELRASTDAPNAASIRVLERLGFTETGRETVDGRDTRFFARRLDA